jgi:hypothetical protein
MVKKLLTDIVQDGEMTMKRYFRTSKEIYDTALSYLEAWNRHNEDLSRLNCLLLGKLPIREHSDNAIDLLSSKCEVLTANPDELFEEYTYLRRYLSRQESEWFSSNPLSRKWSKECVHLKENNVPHGNTKKVVQLLLCLPGSNASIEGVFSRMNYVWSEEKSRFHVDTMQAILAV